MRPLAATLLALMLAATAAMAQPRDDGARGFVLIVDPSNPADHLARSFVADVFLKRVTRWPDGEPIRPVDLPANSSTRRRFAELVLGRSVGAVRSYWQQVIFTGRGVPPLELRSEADVVAYVASHRGAIGYVTPGTDTQGAATPAIR